MSCQPDGYRDDLTTQGIIFFDISYLPNIVHDTGIDSRAREDLASGDSTDGTSLHSIGNIEYLVYEIGFGRCGDELCDRSEGVKLRGG